VLLYLGFLDADEVQDCGSPFKTANEWETCVRLHGRGVVPEDVWGRRVDIDGTAFLPLIRSVSMIWQTSDHL